MTGLYALVLLAARPDARLRDLLRVGLFLSVRRWYLTAFSVVVLGLGLTLFAAKPALALGLAAAPLLYVVWANTRFAARPALGEPATTRDGAAVAPMTCRAAQAPRPAPPAPCATPDHRRPRRRRRSHP